MALSGRCHPIISLLSNREFFPLYFKSIPKATTRVYNLFVNHSFPEIDIHVVSAFKQLYIYAHEKPYRYFALLVTVYAFTDDMKAYFSFFFRSHPGSPRTKGPEGGAIYTTTGHCQPIPGRCVTPSSWWIFSQRSILFLKQVMENEFPLHSGRHVPRDPLKFCVGFARRLLLSLVTAKPIQGGNVHSLTCKDLQFAGGLQRYWTRT